MLCSNKFVRIEPTGIVHAHDSSNHPRKWILNFHSGRAKLTYHKMFRRHIVMSTNLWHGRRPLQEDMEYTCMRCAKPRIDGDSIIVCGNKTVAAVNFIQSCDYMDCIRSSTACKQCPSEYSFNRYAVIMSLLDTTRRPCYMYDLPIIVWITSVRCVCRSDYGVGLVIISSSSSSSSKLDSEILHPGRGEERNLSC